MQGQPGNRAWGKIEPRSDEDRKAGIEWHPLSAHCADVAAVFEALMRVPTIERRIATLCGRQSLDERTIQRLTALAFLHDIGKANRGFQNKQYSKEERRERKLETAGHISVVAQLLSSKGLNEKLIEALPFLVTIKSDWGSVLYYMLRATISHHGSPIDFKRDDIRSSKKLWGADATYDPFDVIRELGELCTRWFATAFEKGGEPVPENAEFQHAFAGTLMLADWIGSDTQFFRFTTEQDIEQGIERIDWAREQAAQALRSIGLIVEERRQKTLLLRREFGDLFQGTGEAGSKNGVPFTPNAIQKAIEDVGNQKLVILEAETGAGKTEAALWHFKRLFEAGRVDGLYFALPTRVAASQMYRRVCQMSERLFPQEDRPTVVLAVPGYYMADGQEDKILPESKVQWDDKHADEIAHRCWAAEQPKRFLAAQIAVGTIDQALCSILQLRHAHIRAMTLLRHLLVVDEVHASDAYMTVLLERLLKLHIKKAGGHALLMSATLGSVARRRLLHCGFKEPPTLEDACAVAYPAISWLQADRERNNPIAHREQGSQAQVKRIQIEFLAAWNVPEEIAQRAWGAANDGAATLVIRNTVGGAVAVQRSVETLAGYDPQDGQAPRLLFGCEGVGYLASWSICTHRSATTRQGD